MSIYRIIMRAVKVNKLWNMQTSIPFGGLTGVNLIAIINCPHSADSKGCQDEVCVSYDTALQGTKTALQGAKNETPDGSTSSSVRERRC